MVHDDGTQILDPVMENEEQQLCIFDDGEFYTLRKRDVGILKKIDKKTVDEKFWEELRNSGWVDVDIDEDDDTEE